MKLTTAIPIILAAASSVNGAASTSDAAAEPPAECLPYLERERTTTTDLVSTEADEVDEHPAVVCGGGWIYGYGDEAAINNSQAAKTVGTLYRSVPTWKACYDKCKQSQDCHQWVWRKKLPSGTPSVLKHSCLIKSKEIVQNAYLTDIERHVDPNHCPPALSKLCIETEAYQCLACAFDSKFTTRCVWLSANHITGGPVCHQPVEAKATEQSFCIVPTPL